MKTTILQNVFNAMQAAEEIDGPAGAEYINLMADIAHEAIQRITSHSAGIREIKIKSVMSLEEFRKTGHNVRLRDQFPNSEFGDLTEYGRQYAGNCHIELCDDGEWMLSIIDENWKEPDLKVLEERLYRWYLDECN